MKATRSLPQKCGTYCILRRLYRPLRNTQYAIRIGESGFSLSLLLLSALLLLTLSACAGSANAEPLPPVIHYGEDLCEFCGMIISDERYAAGYITADGQQHIFDDIGNMFRSHLAKDDQVQAFFVHNHENKAWLRAEKASYVHSDQTSTPMLSGFTAFESPEKATIMAAEVQGQIMTFDEVLAYYKANPLPQEEHSMEHDH